MTAPVPDHAALPVEELRRRLHGDSVGDFVRHGTVGPSGYLLLDRTPTKEDPRPVLTLHLRELVAELRSR